MQSADCLTSDNTFSYHGVPYYEAGPHKYYASCILFASEEEAKTFIRRHSYVKDLHAEASQTGLDLAKSLSDPIGVFKTPANFMKSTLSDALKYGIFQRWAYDELELEMAADDGMMPTKDTGDNRQEMESYIETLKDRLK